MVLKVFYLRFVEETGGGDLDGAALNIVLENCISNPSKRLEMHRICLIYGYLPMFRLSGGQFRQEIDGLPTQLGVRGALPFSCHSLSV